jgi:hypothetical protein
MINTKSETLNSKQTQATNLFGLVPESKIQNLHVLNFGFRILGLFRI